MAKLEAARQYKENLVGRINSATPSPPAASASARELPAAAAAAAAVTVADLAIDDAIRKQQQVE